MAQVVCVDASFVLALLGSEEHRELASTRWRRWSEEDVDRIAPPLFFAEVTSVLRAWVYHGRVAPQTGEEAFHVFQTLGVISVDPPDLQARAWALAKEYDRPRAYDAQYLALARAVDCDLWTGDQRLINAVPGGWVRWMGEPVQ